MKAGDALSRELERTIGNAGFADFFLSLLRAQNAIGARADQLLPTGLTVARWQIMKVLVRQGGPAAVPAIARELLLTRQAVQKQVDLLVAQRYVELRENPLHRRSPLVALTREGHLAYATASKRWLWLARSLGAGLDGKAMERMRELLEGLTDRLVEQIEQADESAAGARSP